MKAAALTDSTIKIPKARIVIELANGRVVAASGFVIRPDKQGDPTIIIKAGKTTVSTIKSGSIARPMTGNRAML